MKAIALLLLAAGALLPSTGTASPPRVNTFVEFLWAPVPKAAIARQPTHGFLLDGNRQHQVCVAVLDPVAEPITLRIDAIDASGQRVSRRRDEDFRGAKRCYEAGLDPAGIPGEWTFEIHLDGTLVQTRTIEVARSLETASFYEPSSTPYVLGRPNYDPSIPPDEFIGRLIWVMHVDEDGAVTDVEVVEAEGVGILMKERAIAAGYLSLFPPDPSRPGKELTYRRELIFAPD